MKYSILMPYIKRHQQFDNTLFSFNHWYADRNDWEVIIIEDQKNWDIENERNLLTAVCKKWSHLPLKRIGPIIGPSNPAPLFNAGANEATGDFFVLTNPEGFHAINILDGLDEEFKQTSEKYVICACESRKDISYQINSIDGINGVFHMWYQHSVNNNRCYHFCTSISSKNYFDIKGFDEQFGSGYAYEDNDFRDTVLHANIPFVIRDDLVTIHQWHDTISPWNLYELIARNLTLYNQKKQQRIIA